LRVSPSDPLAIADLPCRWVLTVLGLGLGNAIVGCTIQSEGQENGTVISTLSEEDECYTMMMYDAYVLDNV
jgi:hypothetical protein